MNKNMLVEYVRVNRGKHKGNIRGVVVAVAANKVGWSYTNLKAGDQFDKKKGIEMAAGRANVYAEGYVYRGSLNPRGTIRFPLVTPHDVKPVFDRMLERSNQYFKA